MAFPPAVTSSPSASPASASLPREPAPSERSSSGPWLGGPWNPLRVTDTPMPPNLLLLCKVLAVAILATGHYRILPDPFLPFIPGLDALDPQIFRGALQTTCVLAAVALLFNRCVRTSAIVLGACLLIGVVSSKAYYGNNKTFAGLMLLFAGLSDFDRPPYLLRWQLALVYFGAALNKLLDVDWQTGQFFEHWARNSVKNPVYVHVADMLPPLMAGKIMCWGTFAAEFAVAFGLFVPRLVPFALFTNVLFQVGLLEFTGNTFTLFFYGMQAANLAFLAWPERQTLPVAEGDDSFGGFVRVTRLLFYQPALWLGFTALLGALPGDAALTRRVLVAAVLVWFLPLALWELGRVRRDIRGMPV